METSEVFVGREKNIIAFKNAYESEEPLSVIYLKGRGGVGKTKLLQSIENECQTIGVPHTKVIDFYLTTNQTVYNFMAKVVKDLGEDHFESFFQARAEFYELKTKTSDKIVLDRAVRKLRQEVWLSINRFAARSKCVLLMDTFEVVQNGDLGQFLLKDFLPNLKNVVVVIAGRQNVDWPFSLHNFADEEIIDGLDLSETMRFFAEHGIELTESDIENIWALSKGRPILLSLTVDWMKENVDISQLTSISARNYEESLIAKVRELRAPEDRVILHQAHVFHRFNLSILRHLLMLTEEDAQQIFTNLSRFSFMKYNEESKTSVLHDEMRDLVVKYIWEQIDPTKDTRISLSRQMVIYYENAIDVSSDEREVHLLQAEMLYHKLYVNLDEGFAYFDKEFEKALNAFAISLCDLLIRESEHFLRVAEPSQQALITLKRGRRLYRTDEFSEAKNLIGKVLSISGISNELSASAYMTLGQISMRESQFAQALEYYEHCRSLLDSTQNASQIGEVENLLGYVYRLMGRWQIAVDHYKKSLLFLEQGNSDPDTIGATLNNMGYVYRLMGQLDQALSYCDLSRKIREKLGSKRNLALTLNTIGIIFLDMEDLISAEKYFLKSSDMFQEMLDERGKSLSMLELGRLHIRLGNLESAKSYLNECLQNFKIFQDTSHEAETILELSRIFIKESDFAESERLIRHALAIARNSDDVRGECESLYLLGEILSLQSLHEAAISSFEECVAKSDRNSFLDIVQRAELFLSDIYLQRENFFHGSKHLVNCCYAAALHSKPLFTKTWRKVEERFLEFEYTQLVTFSKDLISLWKEKGMEDEFPQVTSNLPTVLSVAKSMAS